MKIGFLFIWLAFASQINLSAQNYFSKVYESDTASIFFNCIFSVNNGFVVRGIAVSQIEPYLSHLMLFYFDNYGNIVNYKTLKSTTGRIGANFSGRSMLKTESGDYIISYGAEDEFMSNYYDAFIMKITSEGNILWDIQLPVLVQNGRETLWSISPLGENYVLTGWNGEGGVPESYIWYLMINGEGEVLWEQQHFYNDTYTLGIDGYVTRDKEILLGGSTGASLDETEVYYAKADSMGNIIWEFTYGTEDQNDGQCFMRPFYNGNILMCGSYNGHYLYFREINQQGEILLSIPYQEGLKYLGNFVNEFSYTSSTYEYFPILIINQEFGSQTYSINLGYFDKQYERIYVKELTIDSLYFNYVNDFRKTPTDNGYMACGWIDTYPNYSKGWIMKMDSLGNTCNGFPNCDTTVFIPNTAIADLPIRHQLIISPNPVANELHYRIECNDCSASENVLIEIYDLTGKLIASDPLPALMEDNTMNTSAWPSGMYIINLVINGQQIHSHRLFRK